ncbi:hypothetical protein LINPERPRIM_LOCUS5127 [Linum perenne]
MDTWLMHCTTIGCEVDFRTLLFTTLTHFGNHLQEGDLPFGGAISALIEGLGTRLHTRFVVVGYLLDIRPQHVLHCIRWSGCPPLNGLGGEGPWMLMNLLRRQHDVSTSGKNVDNASSYAPSPEWMI